MSSQSDVHIDHHGSGTVHALAMRGKENSPNPMTRYDFDEIMNQLHKELKVPPNWVKDQGKEKIAIGTSMSIFNQMRVLSGLDTFSADDVQKVLL